MAKYFDEGGEEKVKVVKKGGFLGRFIAFLLGMIFGLIATIAGLGGAGYYLVAKVKIKDAVGTVNNTAGTEINYADFLTEEYAEKTVLNAIKSAIGVASSVSDGSASLDTFAAITPLVNSFGKKVADVLADYGVTTTEEEVMALQLSGISSFVSDKVKTVEIGNLLNKFGVEQSDIVKAICYGEEGTDYIIDGNGEITMLGESKPTTIGDLTESGGFDSLMEKITLISILHPTKDSDKIIIALAYGSGYTIDTDGVIHSAPEHTEKTTLKTLLNNPSDIINNLKIGDLLTIDENTSSVIVALKDYTIDDLTKEETVNSLKLGELIEIDETSNGVMQSLKDTTIAELTSESVIESLALGDVLQADATSSSLLIAICYGSLNTDYTIVDGEIQMIDGHEKTTLGSLMNGDVDIFKNVKFGDIADTTKPDTPSILIALKDKKVSELGSTINTLKLTDILGDSIESNTLLKHIKNSTISTVSSDIENLTIQQVYPDMIYKQVGGQYVDASNNAIYYDEETYTFYTDSTKTTTASPVLTGTWKYLLTSGGTEIQCGITDMGTLVNNMTTNLQAATLDNLCADGIITGVSDTTLNKTPFLLINGDTRRLGEFSIVELLNSF